jgi:geranylgeranyl pyrophosphate synthase
MFGCAEQEDVAGPVEMSEELTRYGLSVGVAFQLIDDVLVRIHRGEAW